MIFIDNEKEIPCPVPEETIRRAAQQAIQHQRLPAETNLTIVLSDDAQLQELNRDYLGIDAPTDVLSFPLDEPDPETGSRYLGDIILSVERAAAQAAAIGHPLEAEMQLLVVHGILHLNGHDHAEAEEKARMWQAQAEILTALGLGNITIREE